MTNQSRTRWIAGVAVGAACLIAVMAGCGPGAEESPVPTAAGLTPIGWATPHTEPPPLPTHTATHTPEATALVLPSATPTPTLIETPVQVVSLTPAPTLTAPPVQVVSLTPAPTLTAPPIQVASLTPAPTLTAPPAQAVTMTSPPTFTPGVFPTKPPLATLTNTPFTIITARPIDTLTATPYVAPASPLPSATATRIFIQPPTFTPVFLPSASFSPTSPPPSAVVCPTCNQLRLRDTPGTAGTILGYLDANQPVTIIGRTADNIWAQVVLAGGSSGWVATEYLVLNIDLSVVSVTGTAQTAPTAVAAAPGGSAGNAVSGVSSHARQIFLDGLAKGNRAHAFTRVGDSISAAPQFLTQIGQGLYNLGQYGYLGSAISFFSGPNGSGANPFAASSIAARNSWGADSVLNSALAPGGTCQPGETPLACEYRVNKPSVAIIMFGTNDSGGVPAETFRANLQTIVQTSINMGVIPVLSTIPPKHYNPATDGRVIEFNQIIIATARGYDIPLIDYYTAMRSLPGEGLHPDGVHPSTPPDGVTTIFDAQHLEYGYTLRNLTALQMLYTLWQQVLYDADQALPATSPPPAQEAVPLPESGSGAAYDCPGAPPPTLTVGGTGRVTPGLPNKVRSQPSASAAQVGSIPGEGVFTVTGGPTCADGYTWWQVDYEGVVGWTASGTIGDPWVEPWP